MQPLNSGEEFELQFPASEAHIHSSNCH